MNVTDARFVAGYHALTAGAGLVDFGDRTLVEIAGADRAQFLHNLSTNDIRKLAPGAGCEAFLTNVQGKILAHVLVFCGPDTLVLETVPGEGEKIAAHLNRYLIREKVEVHDRSAERTEWLLAGRRSEELLTTLCDVAVPPERLASAAVQIAGCEVWLRRVDMAGPLGFLIECPRADAASVGQAIQQAGARHVQSAAFEAARIEAGFPLYGRDISDKNLPQEVARDRQAISFTKGCYLGQETVARIDALGHVNKTLVGVRFFEDARPPVDAVASAETVTSGDTLSSDATLSFGHTVPAAGVELSAGGVKVGNVTSGCYSSRLLAPLALAYVHRGSNQPGTRLESPAGLAEVISVPLR